MISAQEQYPELHKAYLCYVAHQDELAPLYSGKYFIIYDDAVRGAYDNVREAVLTGDRQYTQGEFMVKRCYSSDKEPRIRMLPRIRRIDQSIQIFQ
jgi:hypothetical protein